jgi:hypothetical protein
MSIFSVFITYSELPYFNIILLFLNQYKNAQFVIMYKYRFKLVKYLLLYDDVLFDWQEMFVWEITVFCFIYIKIVLTKYKDDKGTHAIIFNVIIIKYYFTVNKIPTVKNTFYYRPHRARGKIDLLTLQ